MPIGLGLAAIGRPEYINVRLPGSKAPTELPTDEFRNRGLELLEEAYRLGVRYFDAAPGYGMAESMLLQWLVRNPHPDVQIGTKWGYTYTARFIPGAQQHEVKEHSLEKLREQWEFSRQLLPYLKYYQIHSATPESGVLRNRAILDELGRIRSEYDGLNIGLSTTGTSQVEMLQAAQEIWRDGVPLFTVFQFTFNLLERSFSPMIDHLREAGYTLIVKESLANGRLLPNIDFPQYRDLYRRLSGLAGKYGVGEDAVALRYVLERMPLAKVLSGASTPKQLESNMKALSFHMEEDELDLLDSFSVPSEDYWAERRRLPWN